MPYPSAEQLRTGRLLLEPLRADHAAQMVDTLAAPSLYEFIGGQPPSLAELERRYRAQLMGQSPDGSQWWLNWIIRRTDSGEAIGFVQATVERNARAPRADLAWLVTPQAQGDGVATEAVQAMITWLRSHGIRSFGAFIHPQHDASMAVARRQGFIATNIVEDGEIRWAFKAL